MSEISILMPTRKRLDTLKACVDAFWKTASDPRNFEVLLAWDCDDGDTREAFQKYAAEKGYGNVRSFVFTPRLGWHRQYVYLNCLCRKVCPGTKWLAQWTDDQHVIGKGWDTTLLEHEQFKGKFVLPWFEYDNDSWANHTFPYLTVVPMEWFTTLGMLTHHRQTDWFVHQVVGDMGLYRKHETLAVHNLKLPDPETGKPQDYQNRMSPEEHVLREALRQKLTLYLREREASQAVAGMSDDVTQ